ncbi:hypothetical protein DSECCO2_458470 [anaerobic digester metagenome]
MSCIQIEDGFLCVRSDTFTCPHCKKEYNDEKCTDRINRNKSGYTRVYCECGKPFNLFVDMFGIYHGVMTFKQIVKKYKQKQTLIDTMRGDEQIGLYDDNPKNHGYER